MARGMEFSTQPFDVPRREAIQTEFDVRHADLPLAAGEIQNRDALPAFLCQDAGGVPKVDDV